MENYFEINKKHWNKQTPVHLKSEMYDLAGFKAGKTSLKQIELDLLGDVKGKKILHLQCHFGQDTLSLARMGAKMTGVDFSSEAVKAARELNAELGLDATFVEANVLKLNQHLEGEFDAVFTSYGTIIWLPDLDKWAAIVNHFLKPGGRFYFVDFHPTLFMFDWDDHKIMYDYFTDGQPIVEETTGSYADQNSDLKTVEAFWAHSVHQSMMPLINQSLKLLDFQEYDFSPYNIFGEMDSIGAEQYTFGKGKWTTRFPHVYSMVFEK